MKQDVNSYLSGDYSIEATPVPIPNTEVKLYSADDTWGQPPGKVGRRQFLFQGSSTVEQPAVNR